MSKQSYWIVDPNGGAKALVEGAEERNRWTQVHGWGEAEEPTSGDMVWVHNPATDGRTILPHDALSEDGYWRGIGWAPSAPSEPVNVTKDPALRDQTATPSRTVSRTPSAAAVDTEKGK